MDWKTTLEEILAERRQELGEPPSPDDFIALRAGELSDDERGRLLERASVDPEVARELFDVLRFPKPSGDESRETDEDGVDDRWRALRRRLVAEGDLPVTIKPPSVPVWRRRWLSLAATFLLGVAVTVLGIRFGERGPTADPRINLAIVELLPVDAGATDARRGAEVVTVDADTGGLVLTLAVPELAPGRGPYSLKLTRGDGTTSTLEGLSPGIGGVFVVDLPRKDWTDGLHELQLEDTDGQPVARFELEVELRR